MPKYIYSGKNEDGETFKGVIDEATNLRDAWDQVEKQGIPAGSINMLREAPADNPADDDGFFTDAVDGLEKLVSGIFKAGKEQIQDVKRYASSSVLLADKDVLEALSMLRTPEAVARLRELLGDAASPPTEPEDKETAETSSTS